MLYDRGGVDAVSCDFRPTERPGPHYQGDVRDILGEPWDGMIAFPDCTYLCVSGLHWNDRGRGWDKTEDALDFVVMLANQPIPYKAWENPIGCISTRIRRNDDGTYEKVPRGVKIPKKNRIPYQIIQPYEFGHDASKATVIFRDGLPELVKDPDNRVPGRIVEWPKGSGKMVERWGNQTDSGQNALPPSDERAKERSETYQGIADAMGRQYSQFLNEIKTGDFTNGPVQFTLFDEI